MSVDGLLGSGWGQQIPRFARNDKRGARNDEGEFGMTAFYFRDSFERQEHR
jgi:hypothetical protein